MIKAPTFVLSRQPRDRNSNGCQHLCSVEALLKVTTQVIIGVNVGAQLLVKASGVEYSGMVVGGTP